MVQCLLPVINPKKIIEEISNSIVEKVKSSKLKGVVLGLSGGVDSTLVACLCNIAASKYNFKIKAYSLPSKINKKSSEDDAFEIAASLSRIDFEVLPINDIIDSYSKTSPELSKNSFDLGNMTARIRATVLHNKAAAEKCFVIGTGNKDEDFGIGYYTLFGDGAVHFSPIGNLSKRLVRQLAIHLGYHKIANKQSSAELEENQTDFGDLGYGYDLVEMVTELYSKNEYSLKEICKYCELRLNSEINHPINYAVIDIINKHNNIAKFKGKLIRPEIPDISLNYIDTALMIGRFQPFHNGHLDFIKTIISLGINNITIGVGTQEKLDERYIYQYEITEHIINMTLGNEILSYNKYNDLNIEIIEIPDINNIEKYEQYVTSITFLTKNNSVIVSNNKYTLKCFKDWNQLFVNNEKSFDVSGTKIRKLMKEGDNSWKKMVNPITAAFILEEI